jgi:hypothetical protein
MIVFRKKYDDKKQAIEDEMNKEKNRGKESIKPTRPKRRGRGKRHARH